MTKMFGNLTSTENLEATEDRLGGGYEAIPSDAYVGTIKLAYVTAAASGAQAVTLHVDINGKEFKETVYVTKKDGTNFYVDKQDATKRHPLPGFTTIDDVCLLTTGLGLIEQDTETKTIKLWNATERKEIPTPVPCLTALHDKPVGLGILREVVDKEKKDAGGNYQPTGETRTQNTIDKVFHAETGRTVNEYRQEVATAEFRTAWVQKNQGKDRMKAKAAGNAGGAGASGSGMPGGGAPKKSLFGTAA